MPSFITDYEAYLFGEGRWLQAWEKMGARPTTVDGQAGYSFVVWAPTARAVSVVGDFNAWNADAHPMRSLGASGLWEAWAPGCPEGAAYKFHIHPQHGLPFTKLDPYAVRLEHPPNTASVTGHLGAHAWLDEAWMTARRARGAALNTPMAIYEVHAGSWRRNPIEGLRSLSWRELAAELVPYVKKMGFTHIELLPVMEHPFRGSWGYQVTGYFAPTSRFGSPDDFRAFVDVCHQAGIGVILDWVPGHFPKDDYALARFDGTALYEHEDPRQGEHRDWGTLIFNYGRHEVRNFLLTNALFWLESLSHRRPARGRGRVDAVSRLLAPGGRVAAEPLRRPRESRGDRLPPRAERRHARAASGHRDDCRGVHGVARREPADVGGRPRLHVQVEHGLDARHPDLRRARIRSSPVAASTPDVLDALCLQREFRAAVFARRSRAREGVAARENARRRVAEGRQRCACSSASCTRIPARS